MSVPPKPGRPPPPHVGPVEHGGIRYEQLADGRILPGSEWGGVLAARDAASGALLWTLRLYEVGADVGAPGRLGRYFSRMMLDAPGVRLLIETEQGERFEVKLDQRSSRQLGGPPR